MIKQQLKSSIMPKLMSDLGLKNPHQAPKLNKIVINIGLKQDSNIKKNLQTVSKHLELITAQKPLVTKARKSISGFKIRTGFPIGLKVTLRRDRMLEFLERFICIALPRSRELCKCNPKSIDAKFNFNLGVKEYTDFIELEQEHIEQVRGMNLAFEISSSSKNHTIALLKALGLPF